MFKRLSGIRGLVAGAAGISATFDAWGLTIILLCLLVEMYFTNTPSKENLND